MQIQELIQMLRRLHNTATTEIEDPMDLEDRLRATDEHVERLQVPFEMFDVRYQNDDNDDITGAFIEPFKVTRYGVQTWHGAIAPTIDCRRGRDTWSASVDMYFLSRDHAQQVVDCINKSVNKERAKRELSEQLHQHLPMLLDYAEKGSK